MVETIIFDLSEVLIAGMYGVDTLLSQMLGIPEDIVMRQMSGERLQRLFWAEITEDQYLAELLEHEGWSISPEIIKQLLRQNFHRFREWSLSCLALQLPTMIWFYFRIMHQSGLIISNQFINLSCRCSGFCSFLVILD